MSRSLRIYITADLHWGHRAGQEEVDRLAAHVCADPPDLLILAGDIGSGPHFADCLSKFDAVGCLKALCPGNHDIWVPTSETSLDSLIIYEEVLPRTAAEHGFHYLDHGPLVLPDADLALVGTINWYDYSWSIDLFRERFPDELGRLQTKRFTRGRHNDANFVRWPLDDVQFTQLVVGRFAKHLEQALSQVGRVIAVTHHPPFRDLGFPHETPPLDLDPLLWDALAGNQALEDLLSAHADRIPFAFCGHTHRGRESRLGAIRGYNIGSDYPFKRLLVLDWPAGGIEAHTFAGEA